MFFALSLLFVFFLLGLLIYRSDLFHATSDDDYNYKDDFNTTENHTKKPFSRSKDLKNSSNEHLH